MTVTFSIIFSNLLFGLLSIKETLLHTVNGPRLLTALLAILGDPLRKLSLKLEDINTYIAKSTQKAQSLLKLSIT